jgi:hypothetical protein
MSKTIRAASARERLGRRLTRTAAQTTVGGVMILVALALRAYLGVRRPAVVMARRGPSRRRRDPPSAAWRGAGGDIW